jgi:hypothetical protein
MNERYEQKPEQAGNKKTDPEKHDRFDHETPPARM